MRYNRNIAGLLLAVAVILLLATSLYITPATVSDTDPSTYVIVPTLMLPLFVLFSLKTAPNPAVSRRSLMIGTAAFAAFLVVIVLARLYFTIFFISFRVDLLFMPLAFAALVSLLFGTENLARFRGVMIYSLLASPLILYPVLAQFNAFTQFNSALVYYLIKPFVSGVQYAAPITISANGYTIGIGQACVSIGIFISLVLFLIPVAYFYDGEDRKKALWVASGILLLFVLNIARMLGISLFWLAYGPNSTALLIHSFIGVLLFYVSIVVMILAAGFYGMRIERVQRRRERRANKDARPLPVAAALAFCLVYILLTLNYANALAISPLAFGTNARFNYSNQQIASAVQGMVSEANMSSVYIASQNGMSVFLSLSNRTINMTHPVLLYLSEPNATLFDQLKTKNTALGEMSFFNTKGVGERVLDLVSNNTEFLVYNTDVWLTLANSTAVAAGAYMIIPVNDLAANQTACNSYDPLYSFLYDLPTRSAYNQTVRQKLLGAECMSYNILWR